MILAAVKGSLSNMNQQKNRISTFLKRPAKLSHIYISWDIILQIRMDTVVICDIMSIIN